MSVVATRLVASVGLNSFFQPWRRDRTASTPTSVAHVTSHRTMSLRRQLREALVFRITWRPNWNATFRRALLSAGTGAAADVSVVLLLSVGSA